MARYQRLPCRMALHVLIWDEVEDVESCAQRFISAGRGTVPKADVTAEVEGVETMHGVRVVAHLPCRGTKSEDGSALHRGWQSR